MATDVVSRVTTVIAVVDKATAPVTAIQRKFQALGQTASAVTRSFRAFATQSGLTQLPGLLHSIHEKALAVGKSFIHMMLPLLGLGAGGAGVAGLFDLAEGLNRFVEEGSRLHVVSERIGVTVGNLQDLEYAASLFKVPAEVMDTNLQRLNRTLAQVAGGKNKEATKLLGFVGISARVAGGHVKTAAQALPQIADAMAKIHNPAQRARFAVALFGKGGQALIPVLAQGSRGLAEARADMDKLGRMTSVETEQATALEHSQIRLHRAFDRVQEIIGSALAPYTKKAVDYVRQWIVDNRKLIQTKIGDWVKYGADQIGNFWEQMKAVDWNGWLESTKQAGRYLLSWVDALGGVNRLLLIFAGLLVTAEVLEFANTLFTFAKGIKAITLAMYANPYIAAGAALIAFAILVYENWTKIAHWIRYYWKVLEKSTSLTWGVLFSVIERQVRAIRETVTRVLDDVVDAFTRAWDRLRDHPMLSLLGILANPLGGMTNLFAGGPGQGPAQPMNTPPPEPWKGIPYARPADGTVAVDVHLHGAPPGTRATAASKGRGLRTSMNVGYSMAHLSDVG